ncbi:hypothetical protein P378_05410 [Desulforamulus profundi]|uniref:Uncharacterized protein n=1 Tax=Desulforamulus profundi TaxID=1383067 RepID=A0A2C6MFY1_9FIRM|nr:hypothetical protein [Desulforamulus profundi]PHJ39098.1 hypothetical protein P378_05410 [Desulforamulus profundi]
MEKFIVRKKNEKGKVESTIPLPADYIDALVPPFPIENDTLLEPYDDERNERK